MAKYDWLSLKTEYVNSTISLRDLAENHSVPFNTLKDRAVKEKWADERKKIHHKTTTKTQQKLEDVTVVKTVDRVSRILALSDDLLDKVEQATAELNTYLVTNKRKTKTKTFGSSEKGTPEVETTVEEETLEIVEGNIDRLGLQKLASALLALKEVQKIEGGDKPQDAIEPVFNFNFVNTRIKSE